MKYKYRNISEAKPGDVVECVTLQGSINKTIGKLYVVSGTAPDNLTYINDNGGTNHIGITNHSWKLLATTLGDTAKVGDTAIIVNHNNNARDVNVGDAVELLESCGSTHWKCHSGWDNNIPIDCLLVLQPADELLHQSWSDLYDQGVELEFNLTHLGNLWGELLLCVKHHEALTFNDNNVKYRRKAAKTMTDKPITDYVINIKDSSLADKLRLRQVLLDNGYEATGGLMDGTMKDATTCYNCGILDFSDNRVSNITIKDFINKFKKHNQLRNLAFYKREGNNWTNTESANIFTYVGAVITTIENKPAESNKFIWDDATGINEAYYAWSSDYLQNNFTNWLQVCYEDVFPTTINHDASANFRAGRAPGPIHDDSVNEVDHLLESIYNSTADTGTTITIDSMMNKLKEQPMSTTTETTVTVVGNADVTIRGKGKAAKCNKIKTDLQLRNKYVGHVYNKHGSRVATEYFNTKKKGKKLMKAKYEVNCTMIVSKQVFTLDTIIPVNES